MKKTTCQWLGKYKWLFIGILWVLVIALGYAGFSRYYASTGQPASFWDNLYPSLQLFALEFNGVTVIWELQVARLLAPLMTVYTIIQVAASIFREQIQLLRMRFLKNHTIICGLGRKGYLICQALRKRGESVVVIEQDEGNEFLEVCRREGATVILGSAANTGILRQARVDKAKNGIAVCGGDGTNAEIAVKIHKLVSGRKGRAISCLIHVFDLQLFNLLREREMAMGEIDTFRLEFFNIFESGSRILIQELPFLNADSEAINPNPHLVVVGVGRLGESVIVNAARKWWDSCVDGSGRLRITLVDRQANMKKELLCLRYPQLEEACELNTEEMDTSMPDFERAAFLFDDKGNTSVSTVCVCLDDDSRALSAALTLHNRLRTARVPIIVRMLYEAGLATLLQDRGTDPDSFANLRPFGLLDRTCMPELISGNTYEILARAVHEQYRANEKQKGSTMDTNPSMVSWEELPAHLKESNRNQVEHIRVKMEAVGCDIAITNAWEVQPFEFSPDEIELLAEMEHQRFVKERTKQGYVSAASKDITDKKSPSLVSWQELSEEEKEKDREIVRQLPELLAEARFQIHRF